MKKILALFCGVFLVLAFAVSPSAAVKDELNVAIIDVAHLDPQGMINEFVLGVITFNIMEDLFNVDQQGKIVPELALSFDTNDAKTWTLKFI